MALKACRARLRGHDVDPGCTNLGTKNSLQGVGHSISTTHLHVVTGALGATRVVKNA